MKDLACTNNLLTTLDISKCPALRRLYCAENQLTTLHVSRCPILVDLVNNSTRNEYEGTNTSYWRNDSSYLQTDKYVFIDTWTIPSIDVIGSVSLSISAPAAESSSAVKPAIVVADGQNCMLAESNWYNADGTSDELSEDYIFEDGKSYKLWAILAPDEGYEFTEETTVNITGGKTEKVLYSYSFMIGLEISVDVPKAEKEDPTPIVPPSPDTPEEDAKKAADQEKADAVLATIKLLPSLSKLTVSDENKLNKAINAFMNLTDDQKALIPKDAVEALQKALEKMEILKAEDKDETSVRNIEKKITIAKNDSDLTNSVYGALMARTKAASGNSLTIMWNKLAKADGYIVYAGTCDHKGMEIVSTTKKNQLKLTKIGNRKLVKDTYYKVIVVAYQQVNGYDRAISISPVIHTATTAEKVTNPKSVTVKASKITLKKGKSVTIKATVTPASKKLELKNHRKLRYESSDSSIVSVNDKGKIKAKKKGTAYVFVYAQNGMSAKITVTVK